MGIDITAIFPISKYEKQYDKLIDKIENQEYSSIHDYYQTTLDEGFPDLGNHQPQWYVHDKKVAQRPQLPNIDAELALPQGLIIRFREDGFEIWSLIRAYLAVKHNPIIGQKLVTLCKEIGNDFQANECWIMGDWNPIHLSFIKGEPYKLVKAKDPKKESLQDLYMEITEGEYAGSYDIKGHYTLKIN